MVKAPNPGKFSCEICWLKFDSEDNIPLILRNCGHSACKRCIKEVVTRSRSMKKNTINCPKCKCSNEFNLTDNDVQIAFPKNYSLLHMIEKNPYEEACKHAKEDENYVCLDGECKDKTKCCVGCYKNQHLSCNAEYAIHISNFQQKVHFESTNLKNIMDFDGLRENVKTLLSQIESKMMDFIDKAQLDLSKEFIPISIFNYDVFFQNQNKLKIIYDEKLKCEPINLSLITDFVNKLNSSLTTELEIKFNQILERFLTWKEFLVLNSMNSNIFPKIEKVNNFSNVFPDRSLPNYLEDYFGRVNILHCKLENKKITLESNSVPEKIASLAVKSMKQNLQVCETAEALEKEFIKHSDVFPIVKGHKWKFRCFFNKCPPISEFSLSVLKMELSDNFWFFIFLERDFVVGSSN